jgi:VWFA-related protein
MFTVKNHHGHLVRNLTPTQISIYDNGEPPQQITYFQSQARLPLRLALVIDISDSVLARMAAEKDAAAIFLKHELRAPSDVALVVGFNQRARVEQTTTHDLHLLSLAIKQLPAGGKTAVYDAVALASRQLGTIANSAPSLKAIILMTDGEDNSSKISLQEAEEIAQQNEAVVFSLDSGLQSLRNDTAQKSLKSLSQVTGGEYFRADEGHVREAIAKVENELRSQYAIGYKPAQTKPDGSFHKIAILVPKKFKVRHREGYFAR